MLFRRPHSNSRGCQLGSAQQSSLWASCNCVKEKCQHVGPYWQRKTMQIYRDMFHVELLHHVYSAHFSWMHKFLKTARLPTPTSASFSRTVFANSFLRHLLAQIRDPSRTQSLRTRHVEDLPTVQGGKCSRVIEPFQVSRLRELDPEPYPGTVDSRLDPRP